MARRRLLTILAASAVLSTAFAGPAAALDLVGETDEVVAEVEEGAGEVTEPVEATLDDPVVAEPVEQATEPVDDAVEQLVAPPPSSEQDPESEQEPRTTTTSPAQSTDPADTDDGAGAGVVAAGDVADAPGPRARRGTLWPLPDGAPPAAPAPVTAPAAPASDEVDAPLVAPPPATDAATPAVLALPATTPAPEEDSPALVLVALASLLAAGAWTVGEARATSSAVATETA